MFHHTVCGWISHTRIKSTLKNPHKKKPPSTAALSSHQASTPTHVILCPGLAITSNKDGRINQSFEVLAAAAKYCVGVKYMSIIIYVIKRLDICNLKTHPTNHWKPDYFYSPRLLRTNQTSILICFSNVFLFFSAHDQKFYTASAKLMSFSYSYSQFSANFNGWNEQTHYCLMTGQSYPWLTCFCSQ